MAAASEGSVDTSVLNPILAVATVVRWWCYHFIKLKLSIQILILGAVLATF